jgi:DNA-binding transcriptional MerR regulator
MARGGDEHRRAARRSRLSPKALRLYDGLGLLSPAIVDELSAYRYYEDAQLEQARLIATLRHVGVPLTTVKELLELDPVELAERGDGVLAGGRDPARRTAGTRHRPR